MALGRHLPFAARMDARNRIPAYRWDYYSELMAMYLLGLGSYSHPLEARYVEGMEAHYL